ncbi:MAG: ABC transporter substrate-binding protein [Bryobacteraceae bacterium]
MLSRRSMLMALPAAFGLAATRGILRAGIANGARRIAVVFPSSLQPCAEAVDGLRERLSGGEIVLDLLDANKATFAADATAELVRKPAVVVAVGSDAVRQASALESTFKIVSTMTLEADRAGGWSQASRVAAAVYLDIPIHTQISELRKIFPERTRVGVIRNPGRGEPMPSLRTLGPDPGTLEIADCATADELLPVFLRFRKKVDFVLCLPDSSLYNSATARPLIMASLENRLPIVGFSPAFVRAGAAVGIYPDYGGVGRQTGDLVRRCLEPGDCAGWETPRKIDVAVNAKVLRMLGLEYRPGANPDVVVLR